MAVSATSWTSSAAVVGGPGGGSIWGFRRQYWGALLLLAAGCSGLYVLLYYRASSSVPSLILRHFQSFSTRVAALSSEASLPTLPHQEAAWGLTQNHRWNLSVLTSLEALRDAIANSSAPPLLTLFSSWADRPDLGLVRNLTLRNWAQLRPFVQPVLFTNSSSLAEQARAHGWQTLPVSREAVGVPILKNMYLDAMDRFNSTLYAFANGDVLFTLSLIHTLLAILTSPHLPLDSQPVLVVGTRVNVNMVTARETETFDDIINMARMRGKVFTTMAEDYFVTDRRFPWDTIPSVVIGRTAYDNWLVLNSIQKHHVVVDASKTLLAVHQTTKAGNHEGFTHANSSYNNNMLIRLYKRIHYQGGCVDCAPWRTVRFLDGRIFVEDVRSKPKHC